MPFIQKQLMMSLLVVVITLPIMAISGPGDDVEDQAGSSSALADGSISVQDPFFPDKKGYSDILDKSIKSRDWIEFSIRSLSNTFCSKPDQSQLTVEGFKSFLDLVLEATKNDLECAIKLNELISIDGRGPGRTEINPGFYGSGVKFSLLEDPQAIIAVHNIHHFVFYQFKFRMEYPKHIKDFLESMDALDIPEAIRDTFGFQFEERKKFIKNPLFFADQRMNKFLAYERPVRRFVIMPAQCLYIPGYKE
ncbi:MAG: hypothetical protein C0582_03290 [Alphaproteobacteria bacterium]|nr:MAG: hypothetical protein C0582_03290 [Alphaproteobacteria bacterium]